MSNPQLTEYLSNANVRRFLDMLSAAEGTTTHSYNTLFGGNRFDSLGQHPRQSLEFTETTGRRNRSDAAGRYGFLSSSWDEQAKKLGLKDFGPLSQDLAAINLLRERNILPHILNGEWDIAIQKAGPIWASLPSSPYPQPRRSREFVMNELNNPSAASTAPARSYSTASLKKALEKARAANDSEAAFEIQSMLQGRIESALKKAEAAGDTEAVQELTLSLQNLPVAVAPAPAAPQASEAPQPGAAPMGTPTQAPDFDPSQRDMGGLGTPQSAPEAPVAPQTAPVTPSAAPTVSGTPAPSTTLPTTVVTAPTPQPDVNSLSVLQDTPQAPSAAPTEPQQSWWRGLKVPGTDYRPFKLTPEQMKLSDAGFEKDPKWISNARKIYEETNRKPFEGSDVDAAKWLKSYIAMSKHNMTAGVGTILDITNRMSDEGKQAFLQSFKEYSDAPSSLESFGRAVGAIATDPLTYAGGIVGKTALQLAGRKATDKAIMSVVERGIQKNLANQAIKNTTVPIPGATLPTQLVLQGMNKVGQAATSPVTRAGVVGAGYGVSQNLIDQGQQVAAGGQEDIDPTQLGISAGAGFGMGAGAGILGRALTGTSRLEKLAEKSGPDVFTNAEIIKKVAEEAGRKDRTNLNGVTNLRRQESNARVSNDIVREAQSIIKAFPNDDPNKKILLDAASRGINNSQRELDELAQVPGGPELVEVIQKAVKAKALTAPDASSQNFILRGARTASDWLLPGMVSKPINYMLKPRSSSEEVTAKLLSQYGGAAEKIAGMQNPVLSPANQGLQTLREMQQQAAAEVTARRATAAEEKAARAATREADLGVRAEIVQQRWERGETARGGVQGVTTEYTGLKDKDLIRAVEGLAAENPKLAPYLERFKRGEDIGPVLTPIQDELASWASRNGIKADPAIVRKSVVSSGFTKTEGIPNSTFVEAKRIIDTMDDATVAQILGGRTTSASGKELGNPRGYSTGILATIMNDANKGRELTPEAQGILNLIGK